MASKPVVAYYYDDEIGNYSYGGGNPMRPHRVRLTHMLVGDYGLHSKLQVHRPHPRTGREMTMFHSDDYVHFLQKVTPDNQTEYLTQLRRFNLGLPGETDCPPFDGLFEYCQSYSGASVNGAALLAEKTADICLNWSGGMHHAKKSEASGFCYINDIVLSILELLKTFPRVLYVDIDIHHGDGVEEAFYCTDRVMTVSFHKYGDFFPGTGAQSDIGYSKGRGYALNLPLGDGMDDEAYQQLFEPIMQKVMENFQPGAVVVCAGADSLAGDRLGCFNLSLEGHSKCIEFLQKFQVPMLVLGGGGYTLRNVARCWCYETSRILGVDLPDKLPRKEAEAYGYFDETSRLRIDTSNMKNMNTKEDLERIRTEALRILSRMPAAPSVQIQHVPPRHERPPDPEPNADAKGGGQVAADRRRAHPNEYEDSDDEEETGKGRARGTGLGEHMAKKAKMADAQKAPKREAVASTEPRKEAGKEDAPPKEEATQMEIDTGAQDPVPIKAEAVEDAAGPSEGNTGAAEALDAPETLTVGTAKGAGDVEGQPAKAEPTPDDTAAVADDVAEQDATGGAAAAEADAPDESGPAGQDASKDSGEPDKVTAEAEEPPADTDGDEKASDEPLPASVPVEAKEEEAVASDGVLPDKNDAGDAGLVVGDDQPAQDPVAEAEEDIDVEMEEAAPPDEDVHEAEGGGAQDNAAEKDAAAAANPELATEAAVVVAEVDEEGDADA